MRIKSTKHPTPMRHLFLFPGSNVLYPVLALFSLVLYVFFFWQGIPQQDLGSKCITWNYWWILGAAAIFFLSLWLLGKRYVKDYYVVLTLTLVITTFISLQDVTYSVPGAVLKFVRFLIVVAFIYPVNFKFWPRVLIIFFLFLTVFDSTFAIIGYGVILLLIVSLSSLNRCTGMAKLVLVGGAAVLYLATAFLYCPYSPFIPQSRVEHFSVSYNSRSTSVILRNDSSYDLLYGWSGAKITDTRFNRVNNDYVGISNSQIKKNLLLDSIHGVTYPIMLKEDTAYFSSTAQIYETLNRSIEEGHSVNALTAQIYYDYMEVFESIDSVSVSKLRRDMRQLQRELVKYSIDTTLVDADEMAAEKNLRILTQYMSLGMLNAISLDMIARRDYLNALQIFSFQFYTTFYDTPIYSQINYNFNVEVLKDVYSFNSEDLKNEDTFVYWTHMFTICAQIADIYQCKKDAAYRRAFLNALVSEGALPAFNRIVSIFSNSSVRSRYMERSMERMPRLYEYANQLYDFLLYCIKEDYYPDYNSYFLNRFDEIAPLLMTRQAQAYGQLREHYEDRIAEKSAEISTQGWRLGY